MPKKGNEPLMNGQKLSKAMLKSISEMRIVLDLNKQVPSTQFPLIIWFNL